MFNWKRQSYESSTPTLETACRIGSAAQTQREGILKSVQYEGPENDEEQEEGGNDEGDRVAFALTFFKGVHRCFFDLDVGFKQSNGS